MSAIIGAHASASRGTVTLGDSRLAAAVFLALFSFFVEIITGNVPATVAPQMLLIVLSLVINYGSAAILIREAAARWGRGLTCVVILGFAYGMVNEGLCSKGFFNPRYYSVLELGLEGFGRWGGVNVVWALGLTAFHAAVSITVPIVTTEAVFPGTAGRLSGAATAALALAFLADTTFMCVMFRADGYWPGGGTLLTLAAVIALAVIAARRAPSPAPRDGRVPGDLVLFGAAWAAMTAFMIVFGIRRLGPIADLILMLALLAFYARLLLRLPDLAPASKVAMAAGVYAAPAVAALAGGHPIRALIAVLLMLFARRRAARISA